MEDDGSLVTSGEKQRKSSYIGKETVEVRLHLEREKGSPVTSKERHGKSSYIQGKTWEVQLIGKKSNYQFVFLIFAEKLFFLENVWGSLAIFVAGQDLRRS